MKPQKNNDNSRSERGVEERMNKIEKINNERDSVELAHKLADQDIDKDPDLSIHSPNDDLDEGETARLGGDKTDLI